MKDLPCPDPSNLDNPQIVYHEPALLYRPEALKTPCPALDGTKPLCCNDDVVAIMTRNFLQLDAVFGKDCPICSSNLKRLFCYYSCDPNNANFVVGNGYTMDNATGTPTNITLANYSISEDYACTLFQSCSKVSFISQASLTSSIAFLDFLGVNGKLQGKIAISYNITNVEGKTLNGDAKGCGYAVPSDGTYLNYTKVSNCTCTYCDEACVPSTISNAIGFFDGFDVALVGITYGVLVAFSVIFLLVRAKCFKTDPSLLALVQNQGGRINNTEFYSSQGQKYSHKVGDSKVKENLI